MARIGDHYHRILEGIRAELEGTDWEFRTGIAGGLVQPDGVLQRRAGGPAYVVEVDWGPPSEPTSLGAVAEASTAKHEFEDAHPGSEVRAVLLTNRSSEGLVDSSAKELGIEILKVPAEEDTVHIPGLRELLD